MTSKSFKLPIKEFDFQFSRSSGAGGQNVNKVNTKVTLRWNILKTKAINNGVRERFIAKFKRRINEEGEVMVISQRYRDQGRNVADAIAKLEAMISEVWQAPKKRKATKPTKASVEKRLKTKRSHSEKKRLRQKKDFTS